MFIYLLLMLHVIANVIQLKFKKIKIMMSVL